MIALLLLFSLAHADKKIPGSSYAVCGQIVVYEPPHAYTLDPITGSRSALSNGIHRGQGQWCMFGVRDGFPYEIERDDKK